MRRARAQFSVPVVLAAFVCVAVGGLSYRLLFQQALAHEHQQAARRLEGFAASIEATLARHESLPDLLALDPALSAVLHAPTERSRVAAANAYLEAAQRDAGLALVFLMDRDGLTLASSNWRQPLSLIGSHYAFRPYFKDALEQGFGRFYGVGVTTGTPGWFLAAPLREGEHVIGVIVVKVTLDSIEQALSRSGDTLLLADGDGVVFLSSDPQLRYHGVHPLSDPIVQRLTAARQYGDQAIASLADRALPLDRSAPQRLRLPGRATREYVVQSRAVGGLGWQLIQLSSPGEARALALGGGVASAFALAFVLGLAAHLRQRVRRREELRRIYAGLERRIAERTADLTAQVQALERTEAILRQTRDAAVQAGKLATLGQMSAGLTHELNQPLAAMQSYADNAKALLQRQRYAEVAENLTMIADLVGRMGRLLRQLKTFARKHPGRTEAVSVKAALDHALMMVEPRRREIGATVVVAVPEDIRVRAEAGRLEQVLVNLLRNGLDAMADISASPRQLEVRAVCSSEWMTLRVRDQGPGLTADSQAHLFEPFFTTKASGEGLGLGLAISRIIVEGAGGELSACNVADGGAEFSLRLPRVATAERSVNEESNA